MYEKRSYELYNGISQANPRALNGSTRDLTVTLRGFILTLKVLVIQIVGIQDIGSGTFTQPPKGSGCRLQSLPFRLRWKVSQP